ncbi:MurR/RpiR family transcriptional regulator [[Clostridium] spiroforme]|nr:MurR/RpiR family transcriptional regulator [Thomasclavelia spiroformis]MBM6880240.1 MurR/RpiR family transcriptional regulator [Thomasclavelia spiroformis]
MFTGEILKKYNELDMKIYEFIIHNSLEVTYMSIRELAQAIPTSTASIIRFCKKNGYEGYNEFKYAFRSSMKQETVYRHYDHNDGKLFKKNLIIRFIMSESMRLLFY